MSRNSSKKTGSISDKQILIADDQPLFREGLTKLINQEAHIGVCGEAATAEEAFQKAQELKPDLLILELTLKDSSGLDLIKSIRATFPELPILVLSAHDEILYAERALKAGARGYVMKQESSEDVIHAIRNILKNKIYVSEKISEKMLEKQIRGLQPNQNSIQLLSDREFEVFELIGRGITTAEIAKTLHLSVKTIETYRANIKQKMGLENNTQLIREAVDWVGNEKLH